MSLNNTAYQDFITYKNNQFKPSGPPLEYSWEETWSGCLYRKRSKMSILILSDGQDGALPLPPLLLFFLQLACGVSKEHYVLFALDLPLEELERNAVKAHHVLRHKRRRGGEEKVR